MNIFYLGHFANYDGYGHVARDYVEILEELGHDVTCRCVDSLYALPQWGEKWVKLCEKEIPKEIDVAIVHKAPWNQAGKAEYLHDIEPIKRAKKKIWYTIFETTCWPRQWAPILEHFDLIITGSTWQKGACYKMFDLQGKKDYPRCAVVPHVIKDLSHIERKKNDRFIFYSEFSRITERKGLPYLLSAYYRTFEKKDNVELRIKIASGKYGSDMFYEIHNHIRQCFAYKTEKLPQVWVDSQFLSDAQMSQLLMDADCYVCTAKGEGFCVPLATAAYNGILSIAPTLYEGTESNYLWANDYLHMFGHPGRLASVVTNEFYMYDMLIDTSNMQWFEADIDELGKIMKHALTEKEIAAFQQRDAREALSRDSIKSKWEEAIK